MPDSAIICFNKAIKLDSLDPNAYFNRAFAFIENRDDRNALKDFNSFLQLTKKNSYKALAYVHIGEIYRNIREDSIAFYYFNLAIKNSVRN